MKAITALVAFASSACAALGSPQGPLPVRVATLSSVLTELARVVGGDEVEVTGLVRPGVDPHTFNPSPADVRTLVDADLVLASGLSIEPYLERIVSGAGTRGRVVTVGDLVPVVLTLKRGDGGLEKDPHWWHSINDMIFATDLVRSELARLRPASAGAFSRRAGAYRLRLLDLRAWAAQEVAALPPARRQLVTSHDAFGYLARDCGFEIHPIDGLSTESEPDARRLAALVDLIRARGIRAIFVESSANPRLVESLISETGARLGGTLYADGLGAAGSGAEDYVSMYRLNLATIVGALSGP